MIPSLRQWFNEHYTPAGYARFLDLLKQRTGEPTQFRHSETPCFLPSELLARMSRYGQEMVEQLLGDSQYQEESRQAIPEAWRVPNEAAVPLFLQADFGLDEHLEPKLVEIQGFPTLYSYQPVMAQCYREAYGIEPALETLLDPQNYYRLLREAIVGKQDPENVVLLEIDPWHQKTRADFRLTEELFGVRTVDITAIQKQGNRLFYERDGKRVRVKRIYNRAIVDELERKQIRLGFDFRDDLDVEWAGHPNWFFRLSKFSMPYLQHPAVPWTQFLDRAPVVTHPERYVLKPLYSFAGSGVIVGPTAEQIAAVPRAHRSQYILQERVDFQPIIETPFGRTKLEIRIMYLWLDRLHPVNTIIRMGRGSQMGVDHNKGYEWVGASAAFIK